MDVRTQRRTQFQNGLTQLIQALSNIRNEPEKNCDEGLKLMERFTSVWVPHIRQYLFYLKNTVKHDCPKCVALEIKQEDKPK